MKAILIDVKARTVTDIVMSKGIEVIRKLIGCECFAQGFTTEDRDTCYVDDEGLINGTKEFFYFKGYPQPLAGNGLVIGIDSGGESVDVKTSAKELAEQISFHHISEIHSTFN